MGDQHFLDKISEKELIEFLHSNKNMISSIKDPKIFIRELRDNDLIPAITYRKIDSKLGEGKAPDGIYGFLSWFETNSKQHIRKFWRCTFREHICDKYPSIRLLRNKLFTEFTATISNTQIDKKKTMERGMETNPKRAENTDGIKPGPSNTFPQRQAERAEQPQLPDSSVTKIIPTEKNETMNMTEENKGKDNMAPGSSSSSTEKKTTPAKSSEISDNELLVTCDKKEGILHRDRLAKGIKCIKSNKPRGHWYLPSEFMTFAGRKKTKNWKTAIRHNNIPLLKLIKDGVLECPAKMTRRSHK